MDKQQSVDSSQISMMDRILTIPQYCIPQHILSLMMYRLMHCEVKWLKNGLIRLISHLYEVNLAEAAETDLDFYPSFNAFFTRELKADARNIEQAQLVSPVDGEVSQAGRVTGGSIVQAKGHNYSVMSLLGGDDVLAKQFEGGQFATIYLSPKDYHRIHMPITGKLIKMRYVPGDLFSVNQRTARTVPNLFARNERLVITFETEIGAMVMVLVGAIFVGSMETVWAGQVTPGYGKAIQQWQYDGDQAVVIEQGEEMGRFNMGSTVVLLVDEQAQQFADEIVSGKPIQLGNRLV